MTLEEEKAAELAMAEAKKAEEEKAKADLEAETEEEKAAREAKEEADRLQKENYETELKREQERTAAAEKATADIAFKLREQKRKEKEEAEARGETFEEKPLTASELETILQRDRQQTRKELQSEIISEKAKKLAGSEAEASLIIEIHKNRTFPEGLSLDEQLEEAYAIANRKSLLARNEELKRALRGKETASDFAAGTHRDSPILDEPKLSSGDIQAIKAAGFVWDGKTRLFVKQLKGGKRILTYDPKTKAQRVIEK